MLKLNGLTMAGLCLLLMSSLTAQAQELASSELLLHQRGVGLSWDVGTAGHRELRIAAPDHQVWTFQFGPGEPLVVDEQWPNGSYAWEIFVEPRRDRFGALVADGKVLSGSFRVKDGRFYLPSDGRRELASKAVPEAAVTAAGDTTGAHKGSPAGAGRDQVIADDLIVQGSLCVGFDCINNEPFGFDTIRGKENNVRLHFLDTSTAGGFPARSWELTANDSASGGLDYMAIIDRGTNRRPFWIRSDAPNHGLMMDAAGRIGLGTSVPTEKLHLVSSDTPVIRLERSPAGFGFYRWDVGADANNFYIGDPVAGNRRPLRIEPGSPTNLFTLNRDGQVGIGLWSEQAEARLDIHRSSGDKPLMRVRTGQLPNDTTTQLELDADGNLYINGTVSQLSSRQAKISYGGLEPATILNRLLELPISLWSYRHQSDGGRHLGPSAEDFHQAFGLGRSASEISTSDLAGVALAAAQALQQEVIARDQRIEALEARLADLENLIEQRVSDR